MITSFLITIIPTLLVYLLFPKIGIKIKSQYFKFGFAWFAGIFLFTFSDFLLSSFLSYFTSSVLLKSTYIILLLFQLVIIFLIKDFVKLFIKIKLPQKIHFRKVSFHLILIIFCWFFSYFFFTPNLATENNSIYHSPVYWDFHYHAAIIQNFAYGDNFPPENESFSGTPMTYHFYPDLIMAIYASVGMTLTDAVTWTSILFLFILLLTIYGICEEFFEQKVVGLIAVLLVITSSSGHFLYYLYSHKNESLSEIILGILSNTQHPFLMSFINNLPFLYEGTMFNLFYYLEERHIIIGLVYLLCCAWIIYNRSHFKPKILILLGLAMGSYFFWHLYICAIVCLALIFVFIFDKQRLKTLYLLGGFMFIFTTQYIYIKYLIENSSAFLRQTTDYIKLDTSFATRITNQSLIDVLKGIWLYFSFGYGLKFYLVPISLFLLWKQNKKLMIVLTAFIFPAFILINTIALIPQGIGENHKLLIPINIVINLTSAYIIYNLFFFKKNYLRYILGVLCLISLTLSGFIETMPFFNSKPSVLYADYSPISLTKQIQLNSHPKAVFIGDDTREIQLAGRRLYIGESAGPTKAFNKSTREQHIKEIYKTTDIISFCYITQKYHINYIEYLKLPQYLISSASLSQFSAQDSRNRTVYFVNSQSTCIK